MWTYNQAHNYSPGVSAPYECKVGEYPTRPREAYTTPIQGSDRVLTVDVDGRLNALEKDVAAHTVKIDGLVKETTFLQAMANIDKHFSEIDKQFSETRNLLNTELTPINSDIAAMKTELTHKANHVDVANAVNALTWRMIGGVAFLSVVMALFKFLH